MKTLLLYMFAIHGGHRKLFNELQGKVDRLYILGPDFLENYPGHHKVPYPIHPNELRLMIMGLNLFQEVEVVYLEDVRWLKNIELIMSDEEASREIHQQYFPEANVEYLPVFLQWNAERVTTSSPVNYDATVTSDNAHQQLLNQATIEANKSSDWWRHVGGLITRDGHVVITGHNHHLPHEHAPYIHLDPRVFLEPGTHLDKYTSIHSEASMIARIARLTLEGTSIYVTTFPCAGCAKLIAEAGIKKVYFSEGHSTLDGESVLKNFGVEIYRVTT